MAHEKATIVKACERAKKMLAERRYRDKQLINLLDRIRLSAAERSVVLAERRHDYWDELAHVTMRLNVTLCSYKEKKFDGEPTNLLTEQISAFIGAAADAAKAGR